MYKIAILGTENTHAWGFTKLISEGKYPELEVVGLFGNEEGNTAIKNQSGYNCFMKDYNDLVGKVDAVMITARHGGNHLKYAYEYIKTGIPVWMDKPITASIEETRELVEMCKKHGNIICGGSMLGLVDDVLDMRKVFLESKTIEGGSVVAPVNMENPYGNFWFYSSHLIQIILSVFGNDVKSVSAHKSAKGVTAIYRYDNFDVTATYGEAYYNYGITLYGDTVTYKSIGLAEGTEREMNEFMEMLHTGKAPKSFEDLTRAVFVTDATIKSFKNNGVFTEIESL